jgi:hypothetical protein
MLRRGPQHGFGLAQMIRAHSSDTLQVDTGSLYRRSIVSSAPTRAANSATRRTSPK